MTGLYCERRSCSLPGTEAVTHNGKTVNYCPGCASVARGTIERGGVPEEFMEREPSMPKEPKKSVKKEVAETPKTKRKYAKRSAKEPDAPDIEGQPGLELMKLKHYYEQIIIGKDAEIAKLRSTLGVIRDLLQYPADTKMLVDATCSEPEMETKAKRAYRGGYICDVCQFPAKTQRGLSTHKTTKHGKKE